MNAPLPNRRFRFSLRSLPAVVLLVATTAACYGWRLTPAAIADFRHAHPAYEVKP